MTAAQLGRCGCDGLCLADLISLLINFWTRLDTSLHCVYVFVRMGSHHTITVLMGTRANESYGGSSLRSITVQHLLPSTPPLWNTLTGKWTALNERMLAWSGLKVFAGKIKSHAEAIETKCAPVWHPGHNTQSARQGRGETLVKLVPSVCLPQRLMQQRRLLLNVLLGVLPVMDRWIDG